MFMNLEVTFENIKVTFVSWLFSVVHTDWKPVWKTADEKNWSLLRFSQSKAML